MDFIAHPRSLRAPRRDRTVASRAARPRAVAAAALAAVAAVALALPPAALAQSGAESADDAAWRKAFGEPAEPKPGAPPREEPRGAEAKPPGEAPAAPAAPAEEPPAEEDEGAEVQRDPYVAFYEWATESLVGYAAVREMFFIHADDKFGRDFRRSRLEGELRVQYKRRLVGPVSLIAEVDLRADDDDYMDQIFQNPWENQELRPIVNLNDFYLLATVGDLDLRAGMQTIGWGTGDIENPTDQINPKDITDLFMARKMGVLSARADYYLADFQLQGIYVPFFIATRLPPSDKRFSQPVPSFGTLPVELRFISENDFPDFGQGQQYAGKISRSIAGFDLSASFYSGLNKIPVARITAADEPPPAPGALPIVTIGNKLMYERINVYGLDFATTLGWLPVWDAIRKFQIHGEAAFVDSQRASGDDYFRYNIGFNYTISNLLFDHDVIVVFEWVDEVEVRERTRFGVEELTRDLSPPFAAALTPLVPALAREVTRQTRLFRETKGSFEGRFTYKFSESLRVDTTYIFKARGKPGVFVRPELVWDVTDNVQVTVGGDIFDGRKDTFFGGFDGDDRAFAQLKVSF